MKARAARTPGLPLSPQLGHEFQSVFRGEPFFGFSYEGERVMRVSVWRLGRGWLDQLAENSKLGNVAFRMYQILPPVKSARDPNSAGLECCQGLRDRP